MELGANKLTGRREGSVLIVDDDRSFRRELARTLGSAGFDLSEAFTGKLAMAKLRERRFNAVLLNFDTPKMGGFAACEMLRKVRPGLSVIVLSGDDINEEEASPLDAGAVTMFRSHSGLKKSLPPFGL